MVAQRVDPGQFLESGGGGCLVDIVPVVLEASSTSEGLGLGKVVIGIATYITQNTMMCGCVRNVEEIYTIEVSRTNEQRTVDVKVVTSVDHKLAVLITTDGIHQLGCLELLKATASISDGIIVGRNAIQIRSRRVRAILQGAARELSADAAPICRHLDGECLFIEQNTIP